MRASRVRYPRPHSFRDSFNIPWSRSSISSRNLWYSFRVWGPIRGWTRTLSTYMRVVLTSALWSPNVTAKNAAVAGAVALTVSVDATEAVSAVSAQSSSACAHAEPPVVYHLTPTNILVSAVGANTSAAAETMSPTETGSPLVPEGLVADGFPAPLAVSLSEWVPSYAQVVDWASVPLVTVHDWVPVSNPQWSFVSENWGSFARACSLHRRMNRSIPISVWCPSRAFDTVFRARNAYWTLMWPSAVLVMSPFGAAITSVTFPTDAVVWVPPTESKSAVPPGLTT